MSIKTPEQLKYTKEHEWCEINGEVATIGITDFAQNSLGEIVFVELPEVGDNLSTGQAFGVVESIKSVSDLYAPLSGEVIEVNTSLSDEPEKVNDTPYEAWMLKVKLSDQNEIEGLLSSQQYLDICQES